MGEAGGAGGAAKLLHFPKTLSVGFLCLLFLPRAGAVLDIFTSSQRALAGSDVLLHCNFQIEKTSQNHEPPTVIWYFQDKEIARYDNKGLSLSPRTSFNGQAANMGDASLSLANVSISDEGIYRCHVVYGQEKKDGEVVLKVVDKRSRIAMVIALTLLLVAGLGIAAIIWKDKMKASRSMTVSEIKGPEKLLDGEETALYCTVSNCPQGDPQVTWIEERSGDQWEIPQCQNSGDPGEAEQLLGDSYLITCRKEGLQSYCSSLRFVPRVGKHRDVTLICRFVWAGKTKEKRFQCTNIYAKPAQVSVVPSLCDSEEILYSLTLRGFYPRDVSITWTCGVGDSQEKTQSREQYEENSDLTFNMCSEARIPGNQFKDPAFRLDMTWEHGSLDAPEYRAFSIQDPDYPWDPIVEPIQDTKFLHNSPTTLQCNISEYFPDALTVTWLRKGAESEELTEVPSTHPEMQSCQQEDNTYSYTAGLTISPKLRDQGAEYICRVAHPSLVKPIERNTGNINVMAQPMLLEPIEMKLVDNNRVQFSITLRSFYPQDIHINWSHGESPAQFEQQSQNKLTQQEDLTHEVTSVCTFPGENFKDVKYKVHVTWNHVTLEAPESRELWVTDFPWRPQVGEIVVPTLGKKKVALSCEISGYFPDALTVSWFRKGEGDQSDNPLPEKRYKVSDLTSARQEDGTFSSETQLTFSPDQKTDQGAEFICRVGHPSLGHLVERRIIPLVVARNSQTEEQDQNTTDPTKKKTAMEKLRDKLF
ncbi:uncharacterized protein LOC108704754 isoform X2 [Xenopus laevis]|uniref:Uncharacterized protein LOC108704754 isoform X2 n=1 Tax=Xenopus laevis TaxID=8355 RepID=A0A8J1LRZ5_XENLA|nr:uncharacterized protein LOC108704754 isoform X2 [Xenopus laevis]